MSQFFFVYIGWMGIPSMLRSTSSVITGAKASVFRSSRVVNPAAMSVSCIGWYEEFLETAKSALLVKFKKSLS